MSIGLLLPGALLALAALALPILIHLARRNERQPLPFAALRWLHRKPHPRRHLRLQDIPLLLLRLLLLALLAVWLAQPVLHGMHERRAYLAVMPGVHLATVHQQVLPADARMHWLAVGFPPLAQPAPASVQPIDSLLRELDASLPPQVPLIVLATPVFDGADAQLPVLSRQVDWRIVPGNPPAPAAVASPPPRLQVRIDSEDRSQLRYLSAAAQAWGAAAPLLPATAPLPATTDSVLAWWGAAALPPALSAWGARGGTLLLPAHQALPVAAQAVPVWQRASGEVLLEAVPFGRGRMLRLAQPLQPERMPELLEAGFPQQLRDALQPPAMAAARADARAHAPVTGAKPPPEPPQPLQPWLALLVAGVFLCERWLASGRHDGARP